MKKISGFLLKLLYAVAYVPGSFRESPAPRSVANVRDFARFWPFGPVSLLARRRRKNVVKDQLSISQNANMISFCRRIGKREFQPKQLLRGLSPGFCRDCPRILAVPVPTFSPHIFVPTFSPYFPQCPPRILWGQSPSPTSKSTQNEWFSAIIGLACGECPQILLRLYAFAAVSSKPPYRLDK